MPLRRRNGRPIEAVQPGVTAGLDRSAIKTWSLQEAERSPEQHSIRVKYLTSRLR